ncbi:SRPBCC domain-containing protein [Lewinella sp. W8]|uniref:SRPBCC domain-containing protein n=1 Tax=Lewinella sp. W8 TaxID=2528208 RepID=UPI001067FE9F|nr:SRPBCC domain-containing protein [Lewinella sp. W8]MTB53212.1 SRPBCC domain-containing protein [Lewinella sp. W8]
MALQLETSILLPHSPAAIWAVLTDFPAYPEWNPFVTKISGPQRVGSKLSITAGGMDFRPTLLQFQPGVELRWLGSFLFRGIFDGEHYFRLTPQADVQTLLEHGEHFRGVLLPVFKAQLLEKTRSGFIAMNEALRDRLRATS